ncbi:MAG TPA: YggS family pyridoxal phosphate-dependent enzyme, partial [Sulfuricaulis sp.]
MNQRSDDIAGHLILVKQSIADAALACTRSSDAIRLIAVSKGHSINAIAQALAAEQKDFGESTTQESLPKISQLGNPSIDWHFLGHLQTNKAKFIPRNFTWLHSLDSLDLARKLSRQLEEKSASVNMLIEVNITRDENKHGVVPEKLFDFIDQLLKAELPCLPLRGLMTIGPYHAPEKEIRRCFADLR